MNIQKIIFLDIDGVLNIISDSYTTAMHQQCLIERHLVIRLNYLIKKNEGAKVVISSSWRSDMNGLKEELESAGFLYWESVVGKTTLNPLFTKRGEQIDKWLRENIAEPFLYGVDAKVCIIDDEVHDIAPFIDSRHIFHVDAKIGITDEIIHKIMGV